MTLYQRSKGTSGVISAASQTNPNSPTQNNLSPVLRQLVNFFKLLYKDSKVSNESDSTSGGFSAAVEHI